MTTEWELRRLAKNLANAYNLLDELKWTPTRQTPTRKMKPSFGPQTPEPDGDWALNLEIELMRDTPDEHIPGGLRSMACDALNHTTARGYGHELRPSVLCAHIYRNAREITEKFPATQDLTELLHSQTHHIHQQITRRTGTTPHCPPHTQQNTWGTAADLAPIITAITGHHTTRQQITSAGRNPKFTRRTGKTGTKYNLAQMLQHFQQHNVSPM